MTKSTTARLRHFLGDTLVRKPKAIIELARHKEWYDAESYYPEKSSSPAWKNYMYQVGQILRYGAANKYFYMYGLDVKTPAERKEYVNFKYFFDRTTELNLRGNMHNSTCILRNKLYFDIFAKGIGVSTPRIRAYYHHGQLFVWEGSFVEKPFAALASMGNLRLFCKETAGECGAGIFILEICETRMSINGRAITPEELEARIQGAEYLFQEVVEQHPDMARLYGGSINTMRLLTVRSLKDGQLHLMPSILRIGANGSYVDNTSQGGIAVGFNLQTGQLHQYGFFKPQFGKKTELHPDTGIRFADFKIPFLKEAEEMALHFHSMLSDIQSIGWDIAIGPDGPIFIEGNDNWEINGPQVGNRGLMKEFKEYFYK